MIEIIKVRDTNRRCNSCGAYMKIEFNEIDKIIGTKHTEQVYELLIGSRNCQTQNILCKECLKELNMVSKAILERD